MTAPAAPQAPSIAQLAFSDVRHELASTRRVLERLPEGQLDYAPHEKSMTLGRLASHVADMTYFTLAILEREELDFAKKDYPFFAGSTRDEIVAHFDAGAAALTRAVDALDADAFGQPWTLRSGEHVIFTQPRGVLVRGMGINHLVHHRAQLGVYLRLLGIPVPGLYGPSADER